MATMPNGNSDNDNDATAPAHGDDSGGGGGGGGGGEVRRLSKSRSQLKLPLRSLTLQPTEAETEAAETLANKLLQSYSLDDIETIDLTAEDATVAAATATDTAYRTKRFYEMDEASEVGNLMASFSQTIRSTSVTPTDDIDLAEMLGCVTEQFEPTEKPSTSTVSSIATSPSTTPTAVTIRQEFEISPPEEFRTILEPHAITPTPGASGGLHVGVSPTGSISIQQSNEPLSLPLSFTNETSQSHTDNIDMYNEPNMESLIDEAYLRHDDNDEGYIDDPSDRTDSESLSIWETLKEGATVVCKTRTKTQETTPRRAKKKPTKVAFEQQRPPSIVVELYDDKLQTAEEFQYMGDMYKKQNGGGGGGGAVKSADPLPSTSFDEQTTASGGHTHVSTPIPQPPKPGGVPPFWQFGLAYFDTTIDEEDETETTGGGDFKFPMKYPCEEDEEIIFNDFGDPIGVIDNAPAYCCRHYGCCGHYVPGTEGDDEDDDEGGFGRRAKYTSHKLPDDSFYTADRWSRAGLSQRIAHEINRIGQKSFYPKEIYLLNQPPNNWKPRGQTTRNVTITRSVSVKNLCRSFGDLTDINDSRVESGDITNMKKSSFSKFDVLQKKNILHVRSSDAGKAQEKFSEVGPETEKNCRACNKVVYKMEEIKAEKNIWHKNCFRCHECSKQLNVDTYQSHGSVLYCKPHFKLLFAPKAVEDSEPEKPKKPELIIRENQPVELPPDVVRASDKPDLGLEELQQLNVRSRFKVFEKSESEQTAAEQNGLERSPSAAGVKRSASILSKLAKFQAKGMNTGVLNDTLNGVPIEISSSDEDADDDIDGDENEDTDLVRAKRAQRERPISFGNMNDIKTKFESGHIMSKEERREERKQEIQNIRSRLFMGKQARIKEMYQQAVADSEQGITSIGKKPEIDIGDKARSLKEKFEKGEIYNASDEEATLQASRVQEDEMAVFESGISKKSRSIFMELDASAARSPQLSSGPTTPHTPDTKQRQVSQLPAELIESFPPVTANSEPVVKCDETPDDVRIETSEISSKFKFFETYKPNEMKKKEFRITPPRDGVVKMPTPVEDAADVAAAAEALANAERDDDPIVAQKSHTTTKMLSMFREMEQKKHQSAELGPKPLKRFTPPPDENRRVYNADDSDEEHSGEEEEEEEDDDEDEEEDDEEEEEGEEEEDSDVEGSGNVRAADRYEDEFLKQAKSAARAKLLRDKFEKWEANEIQREISNGAINIFAENIEENQIESTKSLRAKFENMKDTSKTASRPRYQVNRFV